MGKRMSNEIGPRLSSSGIKSRHRRDCTALLVTGRDLDTGQPIYERVTTGLSLREYVRDELGAEAFEWWQNKSKQRPSRGGGKIRRARARWHISIGRR
jgi:hypothetical protein